jgi:hypothetical protein
MNVSGSGPTEPESCGDDRGALRITPLRAAMRSIPKDAAETADRMSDRALWRRSQLAEGPDEETLRLLDLAAFAEGGLDPDEHDRIQALLGADPAAAADIAAARAPDGIAGENSPAIERENSPAIERIIARACALRPDGAPRRGLVIPFSRLRQRVLLEGLAQWASLAAAVAIAAWLGFAMGSDASLAFSKPAVSAAQGAAGELFDPAAGFPDDIAPGTQT